MANKGKLRVTLTVKLFVMFIIVTVFSSISVGMVSYKNAAKGLTESVYTRIEDASAAVVDKVVAINEKHFQTLHALAELTIIKDENAST